MSHPSTGFPNMPLPPVRQAERWVLGQCQCGLVVRAGYAHGYMGQRLLCARCYEAALVRLQEAAQPFGTKG